MAKAERTNFTITVSDKVLSTKGDRSDVEVTFEVLDDGKPFYKNVSCYYDFPADYMKSALDMARQSYGQWPVKLTGVKEKDLVRIEKEAAKLVQNLLGLVEQGHAAGTPVTGPKVFRRPANGCSTDRRTAGEIPVPLELDAVRRTRRFLRRA